MKALIIEDNPDTVEAVSLCFRLRWPDVSVASSSSGAAGLKQIQSQPFDIVILDINLPDADGFAILEKVRQFSTVPIMILSVRGKEEEQVRGLDLGADDYIIKPFRPRDLLARASALLRRANMAGAVGENHVVVRGRLTLKLASNQFQIKDRSGRLTPTEGMLLYLLMKNAGTTMEARSLLREVWGKDCTDTEVLRTYIRRLRTQLQDDPPQIILTDHGEGYRFVVPD